MPKKFEHHKITRIFRKALLGTIELFSDHINTYPGSYSRRSRERDSTGKIEKIEVDLLKRATLEAISRVGRTKQFALDRKMFLFFFHRPSLLLLKPYSITEVPIGDLQKNITHKWLVRRFFFFLFFKRGRHIRDAKFLKTCQAHSPVVLVSLPRHQSTRLASLPFD